MQKPESERSRWNEVIWPFWSTTKVSSLLGLTEEEVNKGHQEGKLLGLQTQEGNLVFPSFQFVQDEKDESWSVINGLDTVLSAFSVPEAARDWTLASWLNAKRRGLGAELSEPESIVDYLKAGKDVGVPLAIARETAFRWSH